MLYSDYLKYLAQTMPDISGIFTTSAAQPFIQPQPDGLQQLQKQIDTLEKYPVAYQPYMGDGGEGGYQDEDTTIGDGSTLGIDSFGDVMDFGKKNMGTIASTLAFGPVPTLIGKGVSSLFGSPTLSEFSKAKTFQEFFQNQRDQKAATETAARQSAIAQEQANREAAREAGRTAAAAKAAANRDKARGRTGGGRDSTGGRGPGGQQPGQSGAGGGNQGAGGGSSGCFLKGTLVTMLNGSKKEIQEIDLGDEVAKGGKVFATGKFLVNNLYDYKGIKVSGSHMVFEEGNWTRVEDSKYGKALGDKEHTVYVFGCENRRILIEDVLFTDYFEVKEQDKLIEDEKEFFDNWKSFAKKNSKDNLTIINAA